jgi:hypothetical protein
MVVGTKKEGNMETTSFYVPIDPAFCDDVKESSHIPFSDVI